MDWNRQVCGLRGHETYAPDEPALAARLHVSTPAGEAWRCLRCGAYVVGEPEASGPADEAPEVPRGRLLRDLVIMRLLAAERALRALLLLLLALGILRWRGSKDAIEQAFDLEIPVLRPLADQIGWNIDGSWLVRTVREALGLSETALMWIAIALLAYCAPQFAEAYGLWTMKRWGEYLAVVATSVFLPLEIYELTQRVTVLKVGALLVNVAAIVWLLYSKRLFGLRGGGATYHAEHAEESLLTVERAAVEEASRMTDLRTWLPRGVDAIAAWQEQYGAFATHPSLQVSDEALADAFGRLVERLHDNYPFGHPRYVGQMLKPPHPAAVLGYPTAMLINPNNHALDGGPATAQMEKEVVARIAAMFGLPQHLGHLTSSGTIANLEALWVARESHPGKAIAYSADAHYTHSRMCGVLGVEGIAVRVDAAGRMDLDHLDEVLATGRVGTVVATVGTTGLGALDPVGEIVARARAAGARVHVDTAYGGFFALVADDSADGVASAPYAAIARADSVVVDPHKHGLQPYGCGAVLFADPSVGRFYVHDSPYTYFSSDELHLGEISLECSRAGAAAAALWLTLEVLPLTDAGLGQVLRAGRAGALAWADLLDGSDALAAYQRPELDIVTYLPRRSSMSAVDASSEALFHAAAAGDPTEQIHLATYAVTADALAARGRAVAADAPAARILRSTVMKPESATYVPQIHSRLESLTRDL